MSTRRRISQARRATNFNLEDLDQEEILRTVRLGVEYGRLPESTGNNIGDILDRLELRVDGRILNGAVVLFAAKPTLWYPQCQLRLARFKGIDKSEFLDNRQVQGHAFHLLDEAMAFLHRNLPISGRFETERLERIDEPLFPTAALREALVNGFCHRDYTIVGGAVNVAIFDDRLEIWSNGSFPPGVHAEDLKREHVSQPRNPNITGTFYRRGLIEKWGRGTQKIVELCKKAGHPEPDFRESAGAVVVTFRPSSGTITPQVTPQDAPQVIPQVAKEVSRLLQLCTQPASREALQHGLKLRDRKSFSKAYLTPALTNGLIEMTIPEKPNSRLQKYRLTQKGRAWLAEPPTG